MSTDSVLTMEHVSHSYEDGTEVLKDISFSITRGEIFSLSGPSGCGKTTTLRLAAGLETLTEGRIVIDGKVVADGKVHVPPEKRNVGLVFQDMALFPHLTVKDNVAFGIENLPRAEREARVNELLEQVSMASYGDAYPHRLSGGQQQRVALARALAPDPPIILLDEPFSGLDPRLRITIREDTINILKSRGTTTLIVTHDPEEAMYLSDTMAVMRDGRIEQIGTPGELYCQPVTPYVALFFSAANLIRGAVESGCVATPFGPIPAPKLKEGARAVVLIRPEALLIDGERNSGMATALGAAEGTVISSRMLRHSVVTRMDFGDFNGERLQLRVRNSGHFMPDAGARFRVALDSQQTFVFPIRDKRQGG